MTQKDADGQTDSADLYQTSPCPILVCMVFSITVKDKLVYYICRIQNIEHIGDMQFMLLISQNCIIFYSQTIEQNQILPTLIIRKQEENLQNIILVQPSKAK